MILEFTNSNGAITRLYNPYFMKINSSLSENSDTLTAVFKGSVEFSDFKYLKVIFDEKIIFTGVVDSVINSVDENQIQFAVNCRSMSACLLDNHIQPQNMQNITDEVIYERFLKPFNIDINRISNKAYSGIINFGKNTSMYDVVKEYSSKIFSAEPYVNLNGVAILNGEINSNSFYFSNLHNPLIVNSYYCKSITVQNNRRNVISTVYVKNSVNKTGYNLVVKNESALNNMIDCERYLDATPHSGNCVYDANRMIDASNRQSLICTVKAPCLVYNPVGGTAIVNMDGKALEGLRIISAVYTYSNNRIESEIKMYKE